MNGKYKHKLPLSKNELEFVKKGRQRLKNIKESKRITAFRKASAPSCGEQKIIDFLTSERILFRREWYFNQCFSPQTRHLLYFDFMLPDYNLCIEYDGEQHFSKDKTEPEILNDFVKTAYCHKNQINLLRIKYSDFDNCETIICKKIDQILDIVHPVKRLQG